MDLSTPDFDAALQSAIDGKTKPPGSLGEIETLAAQIARLQRTLSPKMETLAHYVIAADHGLATAGVSAYPQAVTRQMVANFLTGGAASNVFARSVGASLSVVDAGVAGGPIDQPGLINRRMGDGTRNALEEPAMTPDELERALSAGRELAHKADTDAVSLGEMGIGNTSAAALISAKLTGQPVADFVGRGTGLDDEGLAAKTRILTQAASRTADRLDPSQAMSEYGGFEIAMMSGAMIGAGEQQKLVLVDGFISTAAAGVALGLAPEIRTALVFCHRSAEPGHKLLCDALGVHPLLDLGLRLGEGTGALLVWPLVEAAAAMLNEMASFESAGVSQKE